MKESLEDIEAIALGLGCDLELQIKMLEEMRVQLIDWITRCETQGISTRVTTAMIGSILQTSLETWEVVSGVKRPE